MQRVLRAFIAPLTIAILATVAASVQADPGPLLGSGIGTGPELEPGVILPAVTCLRDPDFSYALYLPSSYDRREKWPVIFAFSPFGNGELPVRLFQEAAETYGYIVVGSNDSRNGAWEPIREAQRVLWKEVNERFSVDRRRSIAAGFSGGARAALWFALDHPNRFSGVILCGAVFPRPRVIPTNVRLSFFGLVGDGDLNMVEHLELEKRLAERRIPGWLEIFEGGHQWPSSELCGEAVEFYQVLAMRDGRIPYDSELIQRIVERRLASARSLLDMGRLLLAQRKFKQTAAFFSDVASAGTGREAVERLADDPDFRERTAMEEAFVRDIKAINYWLDESRFSEALERMRQRMSPGNPLADRARLALHLASIRMAEMGFRMLDGDLPEEAVSFFLIGTALYPENPYPAYFGARTLARLGKNEEAIEFLRSAAHHHFYRLDLLHGDPELTRLRDHPDFTGIESEVARNQRLGLRPPSYFYSPPPSPDVGEFQHISSAWWPGARSGSKVAATAAAPRDVPANKRQEPILYFR